MAETLQRVVLEDPVRGVDALDGGVGGDLVGAQGDGVDAHAAPGEPAGVLDQVAVGLVLPAVGDKHDRRRLVLRDMVADRSQGCGDVGGGGDGLGQGGIQTFFRLGCRPSRG